MNAYRPPQRTRIQGAALLLVLWLLLLLAGLILLLEPVITYFVDVVFLHKPSSAVQIGGALLTVVAVYIGSLKPPDKAKVAGESA